MIIFNPGLKATRDQDGHSIYTHPDRGVLAIGWAPPGAEDATWGACYYTDHDNHQQAKPSYRWAGSCPAAYDALIQRFLASPATLRRPGEYFVDRWTDFGEYALPLPYDRDDYEPDFDPESRWDPYRNDEI